MTDVQISQLLRSRQGAKMLSAGSGKDALAVTEMSTMDPNKNPNGLKPVGISVPQAHLSFDSDAEHNSANQYPLPPSVTVQVGSTQGAGAAVNTRVYLFNQDILNNITDNGSGAGTLVYTYQDGFAGRVVSNILALARAGVGAVCTGIALRFNVTLGGAGSAASLSTSNPSFLVNNALGSAVPLNFNITSDQTRGDFDTSIEVIQCVQNITRFTQFSFVIPVLMTATCTFYFSTSFKQ